MCQVYSTILMVGTERKASELCELPIRLLTFETGSEAIRCLRNEPVDSVISQWHLTDMPNGELLARISDAKPSMPTVAFVEPHNQEQEIAARSLGVTVILPDDINDTFFRRVVCQILHIDDPASLSLSFAGI